MVGLLDISVLTVVTVLVPGCATDLNSTLDTCCSAVGSTPAFVHGSYGCPFNYSGSPQSAWNECTAKDPNSGGTICHGPDSGSQSVKLPSRVIAFMILISMLGALVAV